MDAIKYFVGVVIFSSIGSFLIVDRIAFTKTISKTNDRLLFSDVLRLVVLGGMVTIGFLLAKETFSQPNDEPIFLSVGAIASMGIYALGINQS